MRDFTKGMFCGLGALVIAMALLSACTNSEQAQWTAYGSEAHVTLYSGDEKVGEWTSTGKVHAEDSGSGYYFQDRASGKLVRITGTVVIETK